MPPFCETHQRFHEMRPHREYGQTLTVCRECERLAARSPEPRAR